MTKRNCVSFIYFGVILMTLLLRVSSSLGVYDSLGVNGDLFFTCVVQILIFGVMPLLLYYLCFARRQQKPFLAFKQDFGIRKTSGRNWLRIAVIAVCMTASASMISFLWSYILTSMGYTSVSSPTDYSSIGVLISQIVLVAVLPAIFEEIAHRGLIYAGYRDAGWKYVVLSALLFSLMHQNIRQTGYTFFDGIIIALVMYYTGSLWGGIAIHFFNNLISVLMGYVAQNGGVLSFINVINNWLFGSLLGLLVFILLATTCIAVMVLLFVRMRKDAVKDGIVSEIPFAKADASVMPLHKDGMLWATIILGVAATVFSFVWGVLR